MSFHLNQLFNAGIISSRKNGRSVIYFANFDVTRDLIGFMVKHCCSAEFANIREDKKTGCSIIKLESIC
jgi:DNA-binding transcriptional ArsR family regulator